MSPNPQENAETADLVTFTEEILNEKFHFLCTVKTSSYISYYWCQSGIFVVYQKLTLFTSDEDPAIFSRANVCFL